MAVCGMGVWQYVVWVYGSMWYGCMAVCGMAVCGMSVWQYVCMWYECIAVCGVVALNLIRFLGQPLTLSSSMHQFIHNTIVT